MTTIENLQEVVNTLDKALSAKFEHNNIYMTRDQILAVKEALEEYIWNMMDVTEI